jgi:methionyl aminopeptidase
VIKYKTTEEIELIRQSALIVSKTLGMLAKIVAPGVTPLQLDQKAEEFIRDHQAIPAFKGKYGFPNTLCTSVNEQVVHGIPNDKPLQDGDIIAIDCGVLRNGFYGDHAYTFKVGKVKAEVDKLLTVTKQCLYKGIAQAKGGNRIGHISAAIQAHASKHHFGIVRELVGHGLGRELHEDPQVPNFGRARSGEKIQSGLVIAIEPMINLGSKQVRKLADNFTVVTADNQPSAHFEHNVAIVNDKPVILSTFDYIEEALS